MTMPSKFFAVLLLWGASGELFAQGTPAPHVRSAKAEEAASRIERLVRELGDENFEVREAAAKALAEFGGRARSALEEATKSTDPEIASRAKGLLERLPKLTHTLLDALGQPIPQAAVTVEFTPPSALPLPGAVPLPAAPSSTLTQVTEDDGRFGIPEGSASVTVLAQHQEYGIARCELEASSDKQTVQLPLVRRGTEAHKRALTGQVVDGDGKPVAGAVIRCSDVRTPGEGLVEGIFPRGEGLTDSDGRFAFYLPPSEIRQGQRGVLIPANSRYSLTVQVPGDDSYFPWAGWHRNIEPVRIELPRVSRRHRFRFAAPGGGWIEDPQVLRQILVRFDKLQNGERLLVDLGPEAATAGRKLLPGKYIAEAFVNGKTIEYLPLEVTAESPDELSFVLPQAVTYRGRVIDGVTGEPVADALLMGWSSTSRNNLALLTAEDWKMLRETPSNPPADHPAIVRLKEFYGVQALVRTGGDGRFEIVRQPDQEFYGLMAFAEDAIPYKVSVGALKPDDKFQIDVGDFPLFPAAKILVKPVFAGERLAVCPRWFPVESGQPEWFSKFQDAGKGYTREFEYVHWLTLNEMQPVYVPAGLRLRVNFESPYNDQWAPATVETIQLEPRTSKEIGEIRFTENLPVTVRVVDPQGKAVEGAPIRQMYQGDNAWSVAHNTDAEGLARFYARRGSAGKFWLCDLPGSPEAQQAENLKTAFQVGQTAPAQPFTITITKEQAELLIGSKPAE